MNTSRLLHLAAFFVAAALCACSNAPLPSSSLSSDASPHGVATQGESAACASPPGFAFRGPCTAFTLTPKGGTANVPADRGYTFAYVFPKSAIPANVRLSFGSAMRGQIGKDPNGRVFPAYTGFGTTFLYVVGSAPRSVKTFAVHGPSQLVVTNAKGFPGKTCMAVQLDRTKWLSAPASPKISGTTLTLTLKIKKTDVPKGKFYLAFACK